MEKSYARWKSDNEHCDASQEFHTTALLFEKLTDDLCHQRCNVCRSISININLTAKRDGSGRVLCNICNRNNFTQEDMLQILPVWIDTEGLVHYELPCELKGLREGEKLLISPYLVYVPLHHLRKGQLASQGHVCCFPQDIPSVSMKLPRLPKDTQLIKVVRRYKDDCNEIKTRDFVIRRNKVAAALTWLKIHSKVFEEVEIDMQNLSWMADSEEMELPALAHQEHMSQNEYEHNTGSNDRGPAPDQCPDLNTHDMMHQQTYGGYNTQPSTTIANQFKDISHQLSDAVATCRDRHRTRPTMDWPFVSTEAVSEYGGTEIFPRAFPWLFPGGRGDFNQYKQKNIDIADWVLILLRYEDGRFASDKMWTFYALNYRERMKNQSRGSYFVKNFAGDSKKGVDEIVAEISRGNLSWIDKISYYNGQVKGSLGYWRNKRNEVNSWISHHVKLGHGPPTFFITLSCAEYWWKDIERLVIERFQLADMDPPNFEETSRISIINKYTIVVQEYFQKKVKIWLETIGKNIFQIKHHWCRFEFAPSRGQVHAHLLAISDYSSFFRYLYNNVTETDRPDILADWAQQQLGFTNQSLEIVDKQAM